MSTASLLVELFVEELPPKALDKLQRNFAESIVASLRAQGLAPADWPTALQAAAACQAAGTSAACAPAQSR